MKKLFLFLLIAAASGFAGWQASQWRMAHNGAPSSAAAPTGRRVLFYQSPMHPWIKSDKPGRCTICGMELTPIYEGEQAMQTSGDVVALSQSQIQVLHVQTAEAKVQLLTRTLQVAGMVDDDATRHRILSAYVDGRIEKLHVNFMGAEVSEGQPLAEIYSPTLLVAESEYIHLLKESPPAPAASIAGARVKLERLGLGPKQIEALRDKPANASTSPLVAPVSGTVVGKDVYEGQYVTMGQKLFELADFSSMWFLFRAYEQDIPWIKADQTVEVTTPSLPGRTFTGRITFLDPNFDEATRSTTVRVELPNPIVDGRRVLLHRLYADGIVKLDMPEVLAVPRQAVIETGPEAVVYVEQGGGAYARTRITAGRRGNNLIEVLSGLKPGDKIVTNGNLLIDGQAEMNRAFMTQVDTEAPAKAAAPLSEAQNLAMAEFIKLADAMAAALAMDDLKTFNDVSNPAMVVTATLASSFQDRSDLTGAMKALTDHSHFHGFTDIHEARKAFHAFSTAATTALEPLRAVQGTPDFQVWECFMVDQAIPGAPKRGRWLQAEGRPGQNPYFGKEMLDCAKAIKRQEAKP